MKMKDRNKMLALLFIVHCSLFYFLRMKLLFTPLSYSHDSYFLFQFPLLSEVSNFLVATLSMRVCSIFKKLSHPMLVFGENATTSLSIWSSQGLFYSPPILCLRDARLFHVC
uniref:Putative ovule protein n=1 Tax=Solanum chacoense TaxID=4108 RepID=A0A0V0HXT4_SOLCH